jgi:hypothetical protein
MRGKSQISQQVDSSAGLALLIAILSMFATFYNAWQTEKMMEKLRL